MKTYKIIILLITILYVYSSSTEKCDMFNPSTRNTCHNLFTDEDRKKGNYCCYHKYKYNDEKYIECLPLSEEEKADINGYINGLETSEQKVISLDCKSSYFRIGLLSLIYLLL